MADWIDEELEGCDFVDKRLGDRFRKLVEQLSDGMGRTIPMACQDWASTKAAYRFLANPRVTEAEILAGHFQSTQSRCEALEGPLLVLHDTTEFTLQRESHHAIGATHTVPGRARIHTVCGVLMHSSLVITPEGLPLGLAAIKFWTRKKFKGTKELKRTTNTTRIPIEEKESVRWLENVKEATALFDEPQRSVHVADREGDIFELFCSANEADTRFLIRVCNNRLVEDGAKHMFDEVEKEPARGAHKITVVDSKGKPRNVTLRIRFRTLDVLPPHDKRKRCSPQRLTVIFAQETGVSKRGGKNIDWRLITNLPVSSPKDAIEKLEWYALRWKIETFHKILKSGCKAEDSKLRSAERISKLIALFCILSWRTFWMTMMNRAAPQSKPSVAFTKDELRLLDRLVPHINETRTHSPKRIHAYIIRLARLGGYLDRSRDPAPGNMVIWRGLSRLTDIQLGFQMAIELMGN